MRNLLFDDIEFYIISNNITNQACRTYYKVFRSDLMPYSFVEFYFNEVSRFETQQSDVLKLYFANYKFNSSTLPKIIDIFCKNFPTIVRRREFARTPFMTALKAGQYIEIEKQYNPEIVKYQTDSSDIALAVEEIKNIANRILLDNEVSNLATRFRIYEKQMEKSRKSYSLTALAQKKNEQSRREALQRTNTQPRKTRVQKLIMPKFLLPTIYPKSSTTSRVDSLRIAGSFFSSARLHTLLEDLNIKRVNYNQGFVTKRKSLFEKKSKFDSLF